MVVYPQFHVYLKIAKSSNYYFKLLVLDLDCLFLAKQGFLVDLVFKIVALEELFALPGPLASIKWYSSPAIQARFHHSEVNEASQF